TTLRREPELAEGLLDQPGGLHFLETELRILADLLAQADDVLGALVDRRVDALLQFVLGHGRPPGAILPAMDYHHVIEAAGAIGLGMVAFSYLIRWFGDGPARRRRWRFVLSGLVFGILAVFLMRFRIDVGDDRFVDMRVIPIALATLIEGPAAGGITAAMAVGYRVWLSGGGAVAGVLGIVAAALAAWVVRSWAQRDGGLGLRHGGVLVVAVWLITAGSFLILGERGVAMFRPVWLPLLAMIAIGLGVGARLFHDVAAGQAAEAARRDAEKLRAVTSLARMAAHEI